MLKLFLGALTSFILTLTGMPFLIRYLQAKKVGQKVRELGPKTHLAKEGVTSMGGIIFIPVFAITSLLFIEKTPELIWSLITTIGFGLIGFIDDFIKFKGNRSLGLKARQKMFLMFLLTSLVALYIYFLKPELANWLIPFSHQTLNLGKLVVPMIMLVYIGTANSVNLADGMDGVVSGLTTISLGAFLVIVFALMGNINAAIFCAIAMGMCLGFLWHNCHPAKIIMGDTGSLFLGSLLASLAIFTRLELYLILIGGVFVVVALSVMLQVVYFKLSGGKRIFRMAPLHHHFELSGWSETQTVVRFWIAAVIFAALGLLGAF